MHSITTSPAIGPSIARLSLAAALELPLDPKDTGRTFEGIGTLSAGASSRLLIDYPEPQRAEVVDYLFQPNFGASLPPFKVEVGGVVNSTCGSEPTHRRTRDDLNFHRGYECWLMMEATARRSGILLDAGQCKGHTPPPPTRTFPMPCSGDFESYAAGRTPRYFSDQVGQQTGGQPGPATN